MPFRLKLHYDNYPGFRQPFLWVWYEGSSIRDDFEPTGEYPFGFVYDCAVRRQEFHFKFKEGPGTVGPWENDRLDRLYRPLERHNDNLTPGEVWVRGDKAFVYQVEPKASEGIAARDFLESLPLKPSLYVPETGGLSGLGANVLADGRVLFGFYHPSAARVYVIGDFNDWQHPDHPRPEPSQFIELGLYEGYFGAPNIWLVATDRARVGDEYKFYVQGGVSAGEDKRYRQYFTDPYARQLGSDFGINNSVVDPGSFEWSDQDWDTPEVDELILYELSVYGFTEGDRGIHEENRGKFKGVTERVERGYFDRLGVNALSLMPLAEVPSLQGPEALGYDPSLFFAVERDFGTPDDLRELVDSAHRRGLAVLLDQVFNHTSNSFNPLWKMILEHPDEESESGEGGLYFDGTTPWGNRVATEKADVQNMLIDACKLMLTEYHVDGFRFDATHDSYMSHSFLIRLAKELKTFKPNVLLVAENLPNQADLNLSGYDGYAQWCDQFHDKIKALLKEGQFGSQLNSIDNLGDVFYFSKGNFAAHTNNVVNYCYSHDENSVPQELNDTPMRHDAAAKDRKGRLGLFATMVALGQPMIYMGQEFNNEQARNVVTVEWPEDLERNSFFTWSSGLIKLRRRYPGLRLRGHDPAGMGQFVWILGPWMTPNLGGGRKVVGWRSRSDSNERDTLTVIVNFESKDIRVDVDFGAPGAWLKLADIDSINDLPPCGSNSTRDPAAIHTGDGHFNGFTLPSSSCFIYKLDAAL